MYLELAESAPAQDSPYIRIPAHLSNTGREQFIREDAFDSLPAPAWSKVMDALEPYNAGMSGIISDWKNKRKARAEARNEKREAKADKVRAKAERIRSGDRSDVIGKLTGAAQNIVGGIFGGQAAGTTLPDGSMMPTEQPKKDMTPYYIGGGILLLGGALYFATRKRKRK